MKCKLNDVDLQYQVRGEGYPLVMIHGYSLDHRVMTGCMEPLFHGKHGFRRIYFDLPGMGQTVAADSIQNSDDILDLVIRFIEQVVPEKQFALVGESYGGYLARGIAHKLPERVGGMLLICPVVRFLRSRRTVPRPVVLERDETLVSELSMIDALDFQRCMVKQTRSVWERFKDDIRPGIRLADFRLLERVRDTEFSFNPDERAATYTKPVSILLARFDNAVGYLDGLKLCRKYPHANLVVCKRAGHNLQIEQEGLFNKAAEKWLSAIELSRLQTVSDPQWRTTVKQQRDPSTQRSTL